MRFLLAIVLLTCFPSHAGTYALYNFTNAEMTTASQHNEIVPIASVTKLFTAALILEEQLDLSEKVKVQSKTTGRFPVGTMVTRFELMKAMLIASDNRAAETLAHTYPGGYERFIKDVNTMISDRNLKNTKIEDASGLKAGNVSTADDLVNFVYSLRKFPIIMELSSSANDSIKVETKKKYVNLPIRNTNPDINKYNSIMISKTGFTNKAGRCLVMLVNYQNEIHGLAILGEKTPKTRSKVVSDLMNSIEG
jgi:D-alanyl-D-alanine endopeptidase (penicillin-binding protein 7)